jgi:ABC-type multidrug transport system fused ATPase/permease subunit
VLRDGRVDQDGSPDKLMARDGLYRDLIKREMGRLVQRAA